MIKMASQKYTILYGRLSQEDARLGDLNSIINQSILPDIISLSPAAIAEHI